MLKKTITYPDFDGNSRTETHYFHLNKIELMTMAMDLPDGVSDVIGDNPDKIDQSAALRLMQTLGGRGILDFIQKLILKSYGIKHADGHRFEKSDEISKKFSETLAYEAIVMELMNDEEAAGIFISQVIPSDVSDNTTQLLVSK